VCVRERERERDGLQSVFIRIGALSFQALLTTIEANFITRKV